MDERGRRAGNRYSRAGDALRGAETRGEVEEECEEWLGDMAKARVGRVVIDLGSGAREVWQALSRLQNTR